MKNIFNKTRHTFVAALLFASIPTAGIISSCSDDFLRYPPELSIPEENAFENPERVERQVVGLYASAKAGQLFGGRYFIYNDIRGEEFINRTSNNVTGYSSYQFTNDPSDTYIANFWRFSYLTINRANKFLADFDANPGVVSAEVEARYRSEAKFLRALCYHALIQLFAKPYTLDNGASTGIPLRLQPETSSANNNLAPSTVAEIYAQILTDLNDAELGLADDNGSANNNTTRAHKNSAIALKTRVLLAMGRYANVITEGNKIVSTAAPFTSPNRVAHALQANVVNVFRTYNTTESVLSFPMADTNPPGTQNQLGYYYNVGNIEYYLNQSAPGIYANTAAWPETDARRSGLTSPYSAAWHIVTKWSGASPFIDWVPIIRYPEVLLNLAEAEAEAGSLTRATALLQAVRSRSDANYTFSGLNSSSAAVQAILLERRIELLGEGFRIPDLQRRNTPITSVGAGNSIPVTDSRYVFPIPTSEALTNNDI
ncbi:RagB/SusD family nutrient uptake outer membrane protein [Sphingobacterium sp. lm-10]|uniref:RagB/SusD family nutrient uptake outer membrane protein n=1 Tax=Sphingobacterium sp. lm-10 TaxID=2944904 RepID=UPI002021BA1B|nr:RagB/SusD family nutrient uptake outer membrane protein [Sphingobacterium sp. lm-10]MCL7987964.1 RagB/SusD family nutrient uptake outer membrane protein [Sphingobacterium sp. lm-10]